MAVKNSQFNLTIRVNGKEVKNTLNGVGKELRSLRARTKNLTEGTEEWYRANKELAKTEKIYDDMKKNQRELLNETKKNIAADGDYSKSLVGLKEKVSDLKNQIETLDPASKKYQKAIEDYKKVKPEYDKLKNSTEDLLDVTEKNTDAVEAHEKSLTGLSNKITTLKSKIESLEPGTKEHQEAINEYKKVFPVYEKLEKEHQDLLKTTDENTVSFQEFSGSIGQMFSSLKSGDLVGFREGMHGVAGGIKSAANAAWQFAKTPFGLIMVGLTGIVLAAKEWVKYNEAAREANAITQQITQLSGDALDEARIRATAIENTFGTDFKETLNVAKNLVNAFGITYEEAFDRIEDGLVRGGSQNGEFLDSLKEYPRLFAQAGFTVEDFQRIVNEGIDLGIYSDKLPDAIKEFSLSVMEETTASREALENAFGKQFTDKLFSDLRSGSITVKDALGLVAAEADNIGLNSQQAQQLTTDLFRSAGEDAGGALVIFEAVNDALKDQADALTPLQQHLKDVADANRELEEAQNDALKSDSYNAFVNELEVTWIKAKADFYQFINAIAEGLVDADTAFRRFVFQSVQYVKDAFTIGADADWEALGKEFDEQQRKIEEAAAKQKEEEQKRQKEKEKQSQKNNPNNLEVDQKALAAEKKRLDAIDALRKEYEKKEEDRLADNATKKAKLAEKRALDEAKRLRAGNDVIEQIKKEHSILIAEAEEEDQKKAEERLKAFEDRKRELLNELELEKAETDQEKEEIKKEQELEKEELAYQKAEKDFQAEMERLQLNEEEKNAVLQALKESHEATIAGIQKKYTDKKIADEQRLNEEKKKLWNDSLNAAISAAGQETKVGQALMLAKQFMAAQEMATQLGLFQSKMALNAAEATGDIAKGSAKTAASAPFPANIPLIIGFAAQVAGIIGTIKKATSAGKSAKKGFASGGYTDMFGQGYKDGSGHEVAGVVHTNEYVVPEIVRRDPEVPQILDYLETKRKKKLGLYATGGDTANEYSSSGSGSASSSSFGSSRIERLLENILLATSENRDILFGAEAEMKRQEQQKKLDKLKESTQIK